MSILGKFNSIKLVKKEPSPAIKFRIVLDVDYNVRSEETYVDDFLYDETTLNEVTSLEEVLSEICWDEEVDIPTSGDDLFEVIGTICWQYMGTDYETGIGEYDPVVSNVKHRAIDPKVSKMFT